MSLTETELGLILEDLDPSGPPSVRFPFAPPPVGARSVGILDASFNPPTSAHLRLLELAGEAVELDARILLLARANVDKDIFGASLPQRLEMLHRLALGLDRTAVAVTSHPRFVDKASALSTAFPENTAFYFILGFDTLVRLFEPRYYEDMHASLEALFARAAIIYANRTGYDKSQGKEFLGSAPIKPYLDRLLPIMLEEHFAAMSSTEARNMLEKGQPEVSGLVPPSVLEYIREAGIYTGTRTDSGS